MAFQTVADAAYIAVLENKLQQAERNIHEFRCIFTHWQGGNKVQGEHDEETDLPDQVQKEDYLVEPECTE